MPVSYQIHQTSRLRCEGPDLTISPPSDNALPIRHELEAIAEWRLAFMFLQCYPQELLLILDIPNSNLILAPHGKDLSEARWEANTGYRVRHCCHEARHLAQALTTFN